MNTGDTVDHVDGIRRGVVVRKLSPTYVSVKWADGTGPEDVHIADLKVVG